MWQEKVYISIMRLLFRASGLLLCVLAIAILLSLFSFNSFDVSFNTASTSGEVKNWMGDFGSYISDLLFQLIGLSAFFLCLILFSWGSKIASRNGIQYFALKIFLAPFCLLTFSLFFSLLPEPDWWIFNSLGGVNGKFILAKTNFMPHIVTAFLSLVLSVLLLCVVIDVTIKDWQYFFRYSFFTAKYLYEISKKLFSKAEQHLGNRKSKFINKITEGTPEFKARKLLLEDSPESEEEDDSGLEIIEKPKPEKPKKQLNKTKQILKSSKGNKNYELPPIDLLVDRSGDNKDKKTSPVQLEQQSKMLAKVLEDFSVFGSMVSVKLGPVVTLHEFEPAAGTKAARVVGLADDIARSMSAVATRIAVVPGKTTIGIELPNAKREMISFHEMATSNEYKYSQANLPIILGKDISGEPIIVDLAKMPHLLIAGTTGSGKSVGVNAMILSLLYRLPPDECKFIMIDPKMLELSVYDGIPHLLAPVVTEPGRAVIALKWVTNEMEERYRAMANLNVRNIAGYNEKIEKFLKNGEKISKKVQTGFDPESGAPIIEEVELDAKKLPFIVVIVDEMADLMLVAGKDIESSIQRLAQMARAAGIHIIMATQRPSVDVITGVIKANFPTRISFQVTSRIDSRTILGTQGAEQLLGQGDMIYMSGGSKMIRVHGPFCSDKEVEDVVAFIKSQKFDNDDYSQNVVFEQFENAKNNSTSGSFEAGDGSDDDLYRQAVMIVKRDRKPSISYVQRQLRIGYNRAAILIERMEQEGIITEPNVAGKREIVE
ncbi:MAG: translocase FtsK [Rickettsiaceae bacterium]|jgi:S-DNA-T family DNA segregation ATPase FtsK/SpoIIIE|nr:translocase FtsK [Rickettsiaceae bacterium]